MKPWLFSLLLPSVLLAQEHAHPHDASPDEGLAGNRVRLTQMMTRNLDLQTVEVELRSFERGFPVLGVVEPEPGRIVALTSRVAGRVTKLTVHDGQRVKAGEPILEVESRVVADPPPRLTFKAPMDGVVLDTHVVLGSAVEPDKELLTIIGLEEVDVVAEVPESLIAQVRPGQSVRIRALAYPGLVVSGEVKMTAASLDREAGTLRVFVHVENPEEKLLPGMRTQLTFVTDEVAHAVVVPRAAVMGEGGDLFVFRQIPTKIFTYERTPVVVGLRNDRHVEIIEGVLPGDIVVTRGAYQLQYVGGAAAVIEDDHGHDHGPGGHQH